MVKNRTGRFRDVFAEQGMSQGIEKMKALYELSRSAYDVVLAQWHGKHKRRRNLWRDMKSYRLPV